MEKFQENIEKAAKATVIIRTDDPEKDTKFLTGFVVGHLGVGVHVVHVL